MPAKTIDDILDELVQKTKAEFSEVPMEFSSRLYAEHAELWIYILQLDEKILDKIKKYAKAEEQSLAKDDLPVWIFVKTWTGPWPGGESEAELKEKREKFLQKLPTLRSIMSQ
ncbi:MAG: hypothetical protein NTX50_27325 [Candidatus Sumerlaeota bacterium]|nr:hypothetical protein [Candidatus Sumerlaeota bacterium]